MRYILLAVTLIMTVSLSTAQSDQCDAILREALAETNENCDGVSLGSICNGSGTVNVTSADGSNATSTLGGPSDEIGIGGVGQIATSPIDLETGGIGVAVVSLSVQNSETQEEETVALVLVGDATLQILSPPEGSAANPSLPAFRLKGGTASPDCSGDSSGLIVQTPQGTPYTLNINGADVTMSSTVYFRVSDDRTLSVASLEGRALVGPIEGERTTVVAGFTSQIELDPETEQIMGEWSDADLFEDFDTDAFEAFETLDSSFMNYEIDIPDEDYFAEIEDLMDSGEFDYEDFVDEFDYFYDDFFDEDELDLEDLDEFDDEEFIDDGDLEDFDDDEYIDDGDYDDGYDDGDFIEDDGYDDGEYE